MWEIENSDQTITVLLALGLGVVFSIIYDIFKAIRLSFNISVFFTALYDLTYSLICTIIAFSFFMLRTKGQPRGYVFVSFVFGFLLWRITLSKYFLAALKFALVRIKRIFLATRTVFNRVLSKTKAKISIFFEKFIKTLKKVLKGVKRLVYNQHRNN